MHKVTNSKMQSYETLITQIYFLITTQQIRLF